jgi:hypothetical protein
MLMNLRRTLTGRIARLEQRMGKIESPKFIIVCDPVEAERRARLAPGERIVTDWYSDVDGFVLARERLTTDYADQGRRCEPVVTWSRLITWKS